MPIPPLNFSPEFIKFCSVQLHIPFWKDPPAKDIVCVAVPGILGYKFWLSYLAWDTEVGAFLLREAIYKTKES